MKPQETHVFLLRPLALAVSILCASGACVAGTVLNPDTLGGAMEA